VTFFEKFHGFARPDRPVAKEAADDAAFDFLAIGIEGVRSEEVHDDVVVVAGVERDVTARFGYRADDVERLIAIERSDFNGDDIFDFDKFFPEVVRENAAADGGLEVETYDRDDLCDGAAVSEKPFVACFL